MLEYLLVLVIWLIVFVRVGLDDDAVEAGGAGDGGFGE